MLNGLDRLKAVLGHEPSFHDTEVLGISLSRSYSLLEKKTLLQLTLKYFEPSIEYSDEIHYEFKQKNCFTIKFDFEDVSEVDIDGFNFQNVIDDILVTKLDSGMVQVEIVEIYGVGARFLCGSASVSSIEPIL